MPQISFDPLTSGEPAGDMHGCDMAASIARNARPRVVMLQSGVKALVEVVGLADVESVVDAILLDAENVDAPTTFVSTT